MLPENLGQKNNRTSKQLSLTDPSEEIQPLSYLGSIIILAVGIKGAKTPNLGEDNIIQKIVFEYTKLIEYGEVTNIIPHLNDMIDAITACHIRLKFFSLQSQDISVLISLSDKLLNMEEKNSVQEEDISFSMKAALVISKLVVKQIRKEKNCLDDLKYVILKYIESIIKALRRETKREMDDLGIADELCIDNSSNEMGIKCFKHSSNVSSYPYSLSVSRTNSSSKNFVTFSSPLLVRNALIHPNYSKNKKIINFGSRNIQIYKNTWCLDEFYVLYS